uniref:Uncharacterized protein n=1 Tax=Arundo donax TaxID=35708 RepID=A0A0A9BFB5_ARUDO
MALLVLLPGIYLKLLGNETFASGESVFPLLQMQGNTCSLLDRVGNNQTYILAH